MEKAESFKEEDTGIAGRQEIAGGRLVTLVALCAVSLAAWAVWPAGARAVGTASFSEFPGSPLADGKPYDVSAGDVDGDGDRDLVWPRYGGGARIYKNDGSGNFSYWDLRPATGSPVRTSLADMDGDTDLDLVLVAFSAGRVRVYLNDGTGTFPVRAGNIVVGTQPRGPVVADLDGDGVKDVAVAVSGANSVAVLKNNGAGSLSSFPSSPIAVGTSPRAVAAADLDGDGDRDLAVTNGNSNNVTLLSNNGDGTFVPFGGSPVAVGGGPYGIAAADLNLDGDIDLAVANYVDGNVSVLDNNGAASFTLTSSPAAGTSSQGIVAADLNGDGAADLAVTNAGSNDVTLLQNSGTGTFVPFAVSPYAVGQTPYNPVAADLNGDGTRDLAVPNSGSDNVSVLQNADSAPLSQTYALGTDLSAHSMTLPGGLLTAGNYMQNQTLSSSETAVVPGDGTVKEFRVRFCGEPADSLKVVFRIFRPSGSNFQLVASQTDNQGQVPEQGIMEYSVDQPVQAGDRIAVALKGSGQACLLATGDMAGDSYYFNALQDWPVGTVQSFSSIDGSLVALQATIQDTTPPDTSIVSGPPPLTNQTSASVDFSANEAGSTFRCRLDGGTYSPCTSPVSYTGLSDGQHTVDIEATDRAGNADPTPATHTWTVDATPPQTSIDSGPSDPDNQDTASLDFSSSEPGSSFRCRLDGAAYGPCTSPVSYSGLGDGQHTVDIEATDQAGNPDPTPASHLWTVDTTPPQTTLSQRPPAQATSQEATFTFTTSEQGVTFECRLDWSEYETCSSPKEYRSLADGVHTFYIRATDGAGNTETVPISYTWTVDTRKPDETAPETSITSGPSQYSRSVVATFSFASDEEQVAFECQVDGEGWWPCTSPETVGALVPGSHLFEVRATDQAGNTDSTPAEYRWVVDRKAPEVKSTGPIKGMKRVRRSRLGYLWGRVSDDGSGVAKVKIALRIVHNMKAKLAKERCVFLSLKTGRRIKHKCTRNYTKVEGATSWSYRVPSKVRHRIRTTEQYDLLVRATDGAGNELRSRTRFRVKEKK